MNASGVATSSTAGLVAGTHSITATYLETAQFAGSPSDPIAQVVGLIPTTTTLTSAPDPSDPDEPVTLTATITRSVGGAAVAIGEITLSIDGDDEAPVTVDANGQVTLTVDDLDAGRHEADRPLCRWRHLRIESGHR